MTTKQTTPQTTGGYYIKDGKTIVALSHWQIVFLYNAFVLDRIPIARYLKDSDVCDKFTLPELNWIDSNNAKRVSTYTPQYITIDELTGEQRVCIWHLCPRFSKDEFNKSKWRYNNGKARNMNDENRRDICRNDQYPKFLATVGVANAEFMWLWKDDLNAMKAAMIEHLGIKSPVNEWKYVLQQRGIVEWKHPVNQRGEIK